MKNKNRVLGQSLGGLDVISGVIDPDYEGEVRVIVANNTGSQFRLARDVRFAQVTRAKFSKKNATEYFSIELQIVFERFAEPDRVYVTDPKGQEVKDYVPSLGGRRNSAGFGSDLSVGEPVQEGNKKQKK